MKQILYILVLFLFYGEISKANYVCEQRLRDARRNWCKKLHYWDLPLTSIIIDYHNVQLNIVIEAIKSILDSTSLHLFSEILIVDDHSNYNYEEQIKAFKDYKVKYIRTKKYLADIDARFLAAGMAKSNILTFLDPYVRCTPGWLEPLLSEVAKKNGTTVTPVVNTIDHGYFTYLNRKKGSRKAFGAPSPRRGLGYDPSLYNGIFTIEKQFFLMLGGLDKSLQKTNSKPLQLSLKIWMCGGTFEVASCSRLYHLDEHDKTADYNLIRKSLLSSMNAFTSTEVVDGRKRLNAQCKSVLWLSEQMDMKQFYEHQVHSKDGDGTMCLEASEGIYVTPPVVQKCYKEKSDQKWKYTSRRQLRRINGCLDYNHKTKTLLFNVCNEGEKNQVWKYSPGVQALIHSESLLCLEKNGTKAIMNVCAEKSSQKWDMSTDEHLKFFD